MAQKVGEKLLRVVRPTQQEQVANAVKELVKKVPEIAARSGDVKVLATQEVTFAFRAGEITEAQHNLLQRAISESLPGLKAVKQTLNSYVGAYLKADLNKDKRVTKAEVRMAQARFNYWIEVVNDPNATAAQKRAALRDVVTVRRPGGLDHSLKERPLHAPESLLNKMKDLGKN